jgi:hypothetical protein
MPKAKVSLCYYCGVTPSRTVAYGRGKGRKPKKISRVICTQQQCWNGFYSDVDAL